MRSGSVKHEEAVDLSTVPDEVIFRESQRRMARRERPDARVLRPCPYCGQPMGKRQLDAHRGQCDKNPRVIRIREQVIESMKGKP